MSMEFTQEEHEEDRDFESAARAEVNRMADTYLCGGFDDENINKATHRIPKVRTAYGFRAVCRKHSRVWTIIKGECQFVEEKYADGGMVHSGGTDAAPEGVG